MAQELFELKTEEYPLTTNWGELFDDFPIHRHDHCELVLITAGQGIHIAEEIEYELTAGDVFIIQKDQHHGFTVSNQKLTVVNVSFDAEYYADSFQRLRQLPGFNYLFTVEAAYRPTNTLSSHLHLNHTQLSTCLDILSRINDERHGKEDGCQQMIDTLFIQLVITVSRSFAPARTSSSSLYNMGEILSYIEINYATQIRLEQLAALAHMSTNNFLRVFKEIMGQSPIDFLLKTRLNKARELLLQSSLPISQIAYQCGFQDSNYFSRQFKKHFNIPPREFKTGRMR